ncbi:RICIN domain-containing protein [Streptomyces mauvecolor]|uniref:RICIN domain-containing protein n=1 Tax=Streptomyces mauvecolor TaxID=58345 RepID=A0ABV9UN80_9ACTN
MNIPSAYRPALGVIDRTNSILFASLHAQSGNGNDAGALLRLVAFTAAVQHVTNWEALGDFNRSPQRWDELNPPSDYRVYNPDQPTFRTGEEYDHMVANLTTDRWQIAVQPNPGSGHWPVHFSALRGTAGPRSFTVTGDNSGLLLSLNHNATINGMDVWQYPDVESAAQRWFLEPVGRQGSDGNALYRLVSAASHTPKCLDIHRGQQSTEGDYFDIWDCHGAQGEPTPGGYQHDTQNFTLEHPDQRAPLSDRRPLGFRGRSSHGWVYVAADHLDDAVLNNWLRAAREAAAKPSPE